MTRQLPFAVKPFCALLSFTFLTLDHRMLNCAVVAAAITVQQQPKGIVSFRSAIKRLPLTVQGNRVTAGGRRESTALDWRLHTAAARFKRPSAASSFPRIARASATSTRSVSLSCRVGLVSRLTKKADWFYLPESWKGWVLSGWKPLRAAARV